jgi:hypothetical protein
MRPETEAALRAYVTAALHAVQAAESARAALLADPDVVAPKLINPELVALLIVANLRSSHALELAAAFEGLLVLCAELNGQAWAEACARAVCLAVESTAGRCTCAVCSVKPAQAEESTP